LGASVGVSTDAAVASASGVIAAWEDAGARNGPLAGPDLFAGGAFVGVGGWWHVYPPWHLAGSSRTERVALLPWQRGQMR
jgi:hypothetical protein